MTEDRRGQPRYDTSIEVDCRSGENFLFAYITNISEMGIFLRSDDPLPIGTRLALRFMHGGKELSLNGEVVWINPVRAVGDNPNPGMGVRFIDLDPEAREDLVQLVRTIAYLQDESN